MLLPFTEREFLDLFGLYNRAFWPVVLASWCVDAVIFVLLLRGRTLSRGLTSVVAAQWAWTAVAYHWICFTRINPAAWLFGVLFVLQAIAMLRGPRPYAFRFRATPRGVIATAFLAYALIYPFLTQLNAGLSSRAPIYAVPCPLTLFTTGVLLSAEPLPSRSLLVVPMAWSVVGASAAILLGVVTDLALPIAAAALATQILRRDSMLPGTVHARHGAREHR